ncbi:MAG: DNA polymerase III subunit gamma/tau [Vicinamibacterales bacterium]
MTYQALARKWRPQTLDDVLGQQAVTRTLRNALKSKRIAQAFVFAGPRGCGKTTTARILARALNCAQGPTPTPCGVCDACVEIAEGRDIDVLEIDAATHTGVDNVREVIIEGLSIAPVRNRYKVFLIDEVHMLSASSFNALLKSIEEPPPHVVFMMATTELHKIPDTVLSRSQIYEFKTISAKTVADRLRYVADQEGISVPDDALLLLARAGEGSMRDSLSAFDQVRAFAGDALTADDVTTVLGLVGRELVFDVFDAVAAEDGAAAFTLVEAAIERGYDLRILCRELARAARDLLLVSVDAARLKDPDVAGEAERARLTALGQRWSREDLLRAFDAFTRAEYDVRQSDHPRFQLEMALVRLMHLRKLVPLAELLDGTGGRPAAALPRSTAATPVRPPAAAPRPAAPAARSAPPAAPSLRAVAPVSPPAPATAPVAAAGEPRDRLLAAIKAAKQFFFNAVVAQAYRIDVAPGRVTFAFLANQKVPRAQCEENREWLATLATQTFGQETTVQVTVTAPAEPGAPAPAPVAAPAAPRTPPVAATDEQLRQEALADPGVQALLEIFPVERTKIEEM